MKKALSLFCFLIISLVFASCSEEQSKPDSYAASKNPSAIVQYDNYRKTGSLLSADKENKFAAGSLLIVDLDLNASTGFKWFYKISDPAVIALEEEKIFDLEKDKPENIQKVGYPVKALWKFKALTKGEAVISFKYYRDWEGEKSAVDVKEFKIKID
ncbi:MAG TPA: hypothetical protein DHW82_10935 [Spirochaetia bacterium]|nr:MAG: hypothetical protein A2Y41_10850 [Spirochaetes bacterium GWB1_36_13]HCL57508.1 hypothetical protein [Spirochaetia bacterium]